MSLVRGGAIHMTDIDAAVTATLQMMFAYGLIASPRPLAIKADASTAEHRAVALSAAERSMVLLKNQGQILPLAASTRSVAVIDADAGANTVTRGRGSAQVVASSLVSPITALRSTLGSKVQITYTPADAPVQRLPPIPDADIVEGAPLPGETPIRNTKGAPNGRDATEPGHRDVHLAYAPNVTPYATTATRPGTGPGWSSWSAVLEVPTSGTYRISMEQDGDTWLYINGDPVISSPGAHARGLWSTTIDLVAGRRYNLSAKWFAISGEPLPQLGFSDVTPEIAAAVKAARQASVAVVFVSETQDEGIDRPNLSLPGDANDLISAVAAANPKTIVVLNTGVTIEAATAYLEKLDNGGASAAPGYSLPHMTAPGNLTLGGVLAIGGHGSAVPSGTEEPDLMGCLSNLIVAFDAAVSDPASPTPGGYAVHPFSRTDPDAPAFLVHLGRSFITSVTLRVVPNYYLQLTPLFPAVADLFASPSGAGGLPAQALSALLDVYGRVEVLWFPLTTDAFVQCSRRELNEIQPQVPGPYNYPWMQIELWEYYAIKFLLSEFPSATREFCAGELAFAQEHLGGRVLNGTGSRPRDLHDGQDAPRHPLWLGPSITRLPRCSRP